MGILPRCEHPNGHPEQMGDLGVFLWHNLITFRVIFRKSRLYLHSLCLCVYILHSGLPEKPFIGLIYISFWLYGLLLEFFLWFKGVSPRQFASDIVDVGMEVSYWYCNKISKPTCVFCFIMNNDMLFAVVFVEFLHFMKVSCDI